LVSPPYPQGIRGTKDISLRWRTYYLPLQNSCFSKNRNFLPTYNVNIISNPPKINPLTKNKYLVTWCDLVGYKGKEK
jgi:hypothetical protein